MIDICHNLLSIPPTACWNANITSKSIIKKTLLKVQGPDTLMLTEETEHRWIALLLFIGQYTECYWYEDFITDLDLDNESLILQLRSYFEGSVTKDLFYPSEKVKMIVRTEQDNSLAVIQNLIPLNKHLILWVMEPLKVDIKVSLFFRIRWYYLPSCFV